MRSFVLNASFTMTWVIETELTPATMKYLEGLGCNDYQAMVPAIWADEVANVFLTLERGKKVSPEVLESWAETLGILPIRIEPPSVKNSLGEIRRLPRTHGLTAYDARYLHLAMREGIYLATKDRQLLAAAAKVGVKLVH